MTLLLIWKDGRDMVVIADTLFGGVTRVEFGPKIFPIPIRTAAFENDDAPINHLDMGFAFAGHVNPGQFTHIIASTGLLNLLGPKGAPPPTVKEVAEFYARTAERVVGEFRKENGSDAYRFEGLVFGWEGNDSIAYTFDIDIKGRHEVSCKVEVMDFEKFGLYAIGSGHDRIQEMINEYFVTGHRISPYEALQRLIDEGSIRSVGGSQQAAVANDRGVELKVIGTVQNGKLEQIKFMGCDIEELGTIGQFVPTGKAPIILPVGAEIKRDN